MFINFRFNGENPKKLIQKYLILCDKPKTFYRLKFVVRGMHFTNNQCVSLISKQSYPYLQTERYSHKVVSLTMPQHCIQLHNPEQNYSLLRQQCHCQAHNQLASAHHKYAELGLSLGTDTAPCLREAWNAIKLLFKLLLLIWLHSVCSFFVF